MSEPIPSPSLWRRLAAIVYDLFLILAFTIVAAFIWMLILTLVSLDQNESIRKTGYVVIWLLSLFGFYQFFWLRSGQTLGMMAWRIQLRKNDGKQLKFQDTGLRWFMALLSAACLGVGYLWCLFDKKNRSWQDIVSKTHLVLLPKKR